MKVDAGADFARLLIRATKCRYAPDRDPDLPLSWQDRAALGLA
jgi:hypothetical protein